MIIREVDETRGNRESRGNIGKYKKVRKIGELRKNKRMRSRGNYGGEVEDVRETVENNWK